MKIYVITNLVNGKLYVGQTINPVQRRWSNHCSRTEKWESLVHRAIQKYGKASFKIEVVQECKTIEELNQAEREWIAKLKSQVPNGYNVLEGGDGHTWSEEAREKMRKINNNRSPEWQRNLKEGMKKRGNEWKRKLSQAREGRVSTPRQLECLKLGRQFGRQGLKGEQNPKSKVTAEIVREIRKIYAEGQTSQQKIADKFGITQNMVSKIVLRRFWKHIE